MLCVWWGLCGAMDERAGLLIQKLWVRIPLGAFFTNCYFFGVFFFYNFLKSSSLMDEVGRMGGWWSFLGQVFQKLEQKWITVFKGTDSLDTSIWTLRSFATPCSLLLVKIIQAIEKSTWSNAYWLKSNERKRTFWRSLIPGIWPRSVEYKQWSVKKSSRERI